MNDITYPFNLSFKWTHLNQTLPLKETNNGLTEIQFGESLLNLKPTLSLCDL